MLRHRHGVGAGGAVRACDVSADAVVSGPDGHDAEEVVVSVSA